MVSLITSIDNDSATEPNSTPDLRRLSARCSFWVTLTLETWWGLDFPSLKLTQPLKIHFNEPHSDVFNTIISFHLFTSNSMCCRCLWWTSAGVFIQRNRLPDEFYWVTRLLFETVTFLSLMCVACVCVYVYVCLAVHWIVGINIVCRRGGTHASRWQACSPQRPLSFFFPLSFLNMFICSEAIAREIFAEMINLESQQQHEAHVAGRGAKAQHMRFTRGLLLPLSLLLHV